MAKCESCDGRGKTSYLIFDTATEEMTRKEKECYNCAGRGYKED